MKSRLFVPSTNSYCLDSKKNNIIHVTIFLATTVHVSGEPCEELLD